MTDDEREALLRLFDVVIKLAMYRDPDPNFRESLHALTQFRGCEHDYKDPFGRGRGKRRCIHCAKHEPKEAKP